MSFPLVQRVPRQAGNTFLCWIMSAFLISSSVYNTIIILDNCNSKEFELILGLAKDTKLVAWVILAR